MLDEEAPPQFGTSRYEESAPLDQTFTGTHDWNAGDTQNYNVTIEFTGQNNK